MTTTPERPPFSKPLAYTLSFLGGFHVMAIEMCAFRTLQWTYGSSIYVSGSLLTLIMVALALGYRLGGVWSARTDSLRPLFIALLLAVGYLGLTSHLGISSILAATLDLRSQFSSLTLRYSVPPAITTVLLYFPPMLALSLVSPFLARALLDRQTDSSRGGLTVGTVMAVSTLGSIAGTLLASFVLVPSWGTDRTLMLVEATTLLIAGVGLWSQRGGAVRVAGVAALVLAVARPFLPQAPYMPAERPPLGALAFSQESLYGPVALYAVDHPELGKQVSFMSSRTYVHSMVYPANPAGDVFTSEHVAPGIAIGAKEYLVLGAALGGAIAATLEADPQAHVVAVEIDPLVAKLALEQMPALRTPNVEWVVEDARAFLRDDGRKFDVVLVDVLADQQIPGHCATWQFFDLVRAHLKPQGLLSVNTNMVTFDAKVMDQAEFSPLRHVAASLRRAGFTQVLVSDFFETGELVASVEPRSLASLRAALKALAQKETTAPGMQAAAAVMSLGLMPLAQTDARPLSDEWFPDHLLHLRDPWDLTFGGIRAAQKDPAWRAGLERAAPSDLLAQVTLRFADALTTRSAEATLQSLETKDAPLCDDLVERAAHPGWLKAFAGAVHSTIAGSCARRLETVPLPEGNPAGDYFAAAEALSENTLSKAVPPLQRLLASAEHAAIDEEPNR